MIRKFGIRRARFCRCCRLHELATFSQACIGRFRNFALDNLGYASISRKKGGGIAAGLLLLLLGQRDIQASDGPRSNFNWYGQAGLLDMPSARMLPDGEIVATGSLLGSVNERYSLTFQALPWLETTFRYARIDRVSGGIDLFDRSLSLKARLWEESRWTPNISIGLQDILGTGVFGAEYVVASKTFGNLEASVGLGWGRFGTLGTFNNPLGVFAQSFTTRPVNTELQHTGQVRFNQFFRGQDAAPFGGIVWRTGFHDISAILEISSDRYFQESRAGAIEWQSPVNFGISYSPSESIDVGVGYFYGSLLGLRISLHGNASVDIFPRRLGAAPRNVVSRSPEERRRAVLGLLSSAAADAANPPHSDTTAQTIAADIAAVRQRVIDVARQQNVQIDHISFSAHEAAVAFTNTRYRREAEAIGRLARVLMETAPPDIELFRFVSLQSGIPTQEVVLGRGSLEIASSNAYGGESEVLPPSRVKGVEPDAPLLSTPAVISYPRFSWSLSPQYRESLFDPNEPFRYQIFGSAVGKIDVAPGLSLDGAFEFNIYDTFDDLRSSDSLLPHVRSDIDHYFNEGKNGIEYLRASYMKLLAPNVYGLLRAGYLEGMFAGIGGEILWRPQQERWAIGLSFYDAHQRNFDRLLGLQAYNAVVGHLSIYYESPYYGLNFNVHAGRYLAGDHGVTLEVTRLFDTGFEIGAFATFTNVPFQTFGEGSFDKGLIIRIPLEGFLPVHSQSVARLDFTSLSRDGGQRLVNEQSLYGLTRRASGGEILKGRDAIVVP